MARKSRYSGEVAEPAEALPLRGLRMVDGTLTEGQRPERTLRPRNAYMACALDLEGKRVLDVGCAEGIHSLYMAGSARSVVGIDHRETVIRSADKTKRRLNMDNVEFLQGDLRSAEFVTSLGRFDLVVAWGLVHRVANPFQLMRTLGGISDALSLEWRCPIIPFGANLSVGYHSVSGAIDQTNVESMPSSSAEKIESSTGFWDPTPGAMKVIAAREGFTQSEIIGFGDKFRRGSTALVMETTKHFVNRLVREMPMPQIPLSRVHMIFRKPEAIVKTHSPVASRERLPEWDVELVERVARK